MVKNKYPFTKVFLIFGLILVFFSSCNCNRSADQFVINGKFSDYGGAEVSLMRQTGDDWETVDKTILDTEGNFTFKGQLAFPEFVYLVTEENKRFVRFFLENNDITITVLKDSLLENAQVKGSGLQDKFEEYNRIDKSEFSDSLFKVYKKWNEANTKNDTLLTLEMDSLREVTYNQRLDFQIYFIKENSDNILGPFILNIIYQALDTTQLNSLVELFDPSIKESIYTKQIEQKIYAIKATEAGQAFIDFLLPDSTGKMIQLSELVSRGNYLVVDFWSTWSGSSLLEIEKKKELFWKYYDIGLQFVSVSLDNNKVKWMKTIEESGMPWIQLIDAKGPRGKVASDYLITGLPVKFLLDPGGNLITKLQTVDELENELKMIFD